MRPDRKPLRRAHPAARPAPAVPRRHLVLTRATLRAAELLGLARKDLAVVLGVSASTVSRLDDRPLDPARKELLDARFFFFRQFSLPPKQSGIEFRCQQRILKTLYRPIQDRHHHFQINVVA